MKSPEKRIEILFEDDDLLVVNKPGDYLSIPDRYRDLPNLSSFLKSKYESVYTIHRLDKDTSGIIVFAKNESAHKTLSQAFENREVNKYYHAVTKGMISETEGTIDKPIAKHPSKSGKMVTHRSGKASISHFKVIKDFGNYQMMEVKIETGRTHQVRVHLQSLGLKVLGDPLYGDGEFFLREIKGKKFQLGKTREERALLFRTCLHAHTLAFKHPSTKKEMSFTADYPKDFQATLKQLEKWKG